MKGLAAGLLFIASCLASEHSGYVTLAGLPVPGVTVTAARGERKLVTVTDQEGGYSFSDLAEGNWTLTTGMTGFSPMSLADNRRLQQSG